MTSSSPATPSPAPSETENPARIFLSWDKPLPEQAAEWLLSLAGDSLPLDLSHLLVIVPTRNAGRRLREMLANLAEERGRAILPPLTAPPSLLARAEDGASLLGKPAAGELEAAAAWIAVLQGLDLGGFRALFPLDPPARDVAWARSMAKDLAALRRVLGESGLTLAETARRLPEGHEEERRWNDLARLEQAWLEFLDRRLGRCDRELARAAAARQPRLPAGIREIILLGAPDPFPLAVQALETLAAAGTPITAAIHAPPALAHAFDAWGRPLADHWLNAPLELPGFFRDVEVVANTDALVELVAGEAAALEEPAQSLAIGACDPDLAPLLEEALRQGGVAAYHPEGGKASREGFVWLLKLLARLLARIDFPLLRDSFRCPEIDAYLSRKISGWRLRDALAALDDCRSQHLADLSPDLRAFLAADAGSHREGGREREAARREMTAAAVGEMEDLARRLAGGPLARNLPVLLRELVGARQRTGGAGAWAERVIEAAAPAVMEGLEQLAALDRAGLGLPPADQLALLAEHAGEVSVAEERPPLAIELQGWLELLWEDAPHLIVAGLNDGIVPEAVTGHPYLPENLRRLRVLGLKTNEDRLARDLYLLAAMEAPRRRAGRLRLLVPKASGAGDPLKPSRLLLRCADAELPARVARLYREIQSPGAQHSWSPGFLLVPGLPRAGAPEREVKRVSVTSFAAYLQSPFHYWSRHVARMEEIDPAKAELDPRDFGNLCHRAMECYGLDPEARAWTSEEKIEGFLLDALEQIARETYGSRPGLAARIQIESARSRLSSAARHEAEQRCLGWRIEGAEVSLREVFPLEIEGVEISGTIDRLERMDGQVRVLDYKTSDKNTGSLRDHVRANREGEAREWPPGYALFDHEDLFPRSAKGPPETKSYRFQKLQLPLYALAVAAANPGAEVHCGYFSLAKAAADTKEDSWVASRALLDAARRCAAGVIRDIAAGRFDRLAPPSGGYSDHLEPLHLGYPSRTLDLSHLGRRDDPPRAS